MFQYLSLSLLLLSIAHWPAKSGAATLFNGTQASMFDYDTPTSCLAAFNTSLNCDPVVKYLSVQTDWAGWASGNLTLLCKTSCLSSIKSLKSTVSSACGTKTFNLGGSSVNAADLVDFTLYKYNITCLQDGSAFCLLKEQTWNITTMNAAGQATWPTYVNKTYPDWANDPINGTSMLDENGTVVVPYSDPMPTMISQSNPDVMAAADYFYTGGPRWSANYGWPTPLEYDEYPTQIQCSNCWLGRFRLGFMSKWGETYDEVTAQIYANMQKNCKFTTPLYVEPLLNISGPPIPNPRKIVWNAQPLCDRNLTNTVPYGQRKNCTTFAAANNLPNAALAQLNPGIHCDAVFNTTSNKTICAPLPCQITTIPNRPQGAREFLNSSSAYKNITYFQFRRWNNYADLSNLAKGDVVCIGPPGGAYVPAPTTEPAAHPTVFTTTATHPDPTPSGTIPNCGKYYKVQQGDYCNLLALNFSLTFDQLIRYNPSLDSNCTNLLLGFDYCVALVNGTTAPPVTSTKQPAGSSTSSSSSVPSTTLPAPGPTASGTTSACRRWHTVQSGDNCYDIDQRYGITLDQFRGWNPIVHANCDNLYVGNAYCVLGP